MRPADPSRPRDSSLSPTKSGATEARKRGGRGKAIWLLFQFRIHRKVRYPVPRICILVFFFWFLRLLAGDTSYWVAASYGISDPRADLIIGNPGAVLRRRAVPVVAVVIFGEPHVWVV